VLTLAHTECNGYIRAMAFDQAKADAICARVSEGEPLAQVCRDIGLGRTTVYDWQHDIPAFAERIAHARVIGYDAIAEEALQIANTPVEGVIVKTDADGETVTREDMLGHRKLQVETRLKLLAKWDPKRYGDRLHTDNDTRVEVVIRDLTKEST
jgi:transposase-like protein